MKKTYLTLTGLLIIIFLVIHFCLINQVARGEAFRGKFKVFKQGNTISSDGLQYSCLESNIYEMAAFGEKFPEVREFYAYETNRYVIMGTEDAFWRLKYVVAAKIRIVNKSDKEQDVVFSDYALTSENETLLQGVYPELIKVLNDGIIEKKMAPGETLDIQLCYDITEANVGDLTYEKLKDMKLMIPVTGYPKLEALSLTDAALVKSDGSFHPYPSEDKSSSGEQNPVPDDTSAGTVVRVGQDLVENGVSYHVEQVKIVTNLEDYEEYDDSAWLSWYAAGFLGKNGTFTTCAEKDHGLLEKYYKKGYQDYAIFVKLRITNHTSQDVHIYNCFELFNSDRSLEGATTPEYVSLLRDSKEKDVYKGYIEGGAEEYIVLGYTRSILSDIDIYKTPLYISNQSDIATNTFNLDQGKGGFGIYLQIQ